MENLCITEGKTSTTKPCVDSRLPIVHPVVIGAPETSISLETESTSLSGSESDSGSEWTNQVLPIGSNSVLAPASTINVESSSDVIIGPLTQFHGPVTIYQTVSSNTQSRNGAIENHKLGLEDPQKANLPAKCVTDNIRAKNGKLDRKTCTKTGLWIFMLVTIFVTVTVGIVIFLKTTASLESNSPNNETVTEAPGDTTVPAGFPRHMYTRKEWGGSPPSHLVKSLIHPTKHVVICHTDGPFCNNFKRCSVLVRNIQAYHMQELGSSDIGYNFLIGDDGAIYVGRNWDIRNILADANIGIAIMGSFVSRDIMTQQMIDTLKDLLELGVKSNKLATDYKLVCHNQTDNTESPGKNVCNQIAKFPNYFPGEVHLPDE